MYLRGSIISPAAACPSTLNRLSVFCVPHVRCFGAPTRGHHPRGCSNLAGHRGQHSCPAGLHGARNHGPSGQPMYTGKQMLHPHAPLTLYCRATLAFHSASLHPMLQVTACSTMDCSPGTCVVGPQGPQCDHMSVTSDYPGLPPLFDPGTLPPGRGPPPSSSPSSTPTPRPSAPVAVLMPCPGTTGEGAPCSGHGTCSHSTPGCLAGDLECFTTCRYAVCEATKEPKH